MHISNTYFPTLTINNWISVFLDFPGTNFFVLESMQYLYENEMARFYAFVIMRDHLHFVWKINSKHTEIGLVCKLKQYTANKIIKYIESTDEDYLRYFLSGRKDRMYKVWKLKHGSIEMQGQKMLIQKILYTHQNPTKGNYNSVENPDDYYFSSAKSYLAQVKNFPFLTLIDGIPLAK